MTTIARLKVLLEADSHRLTSALHQVRRTVFNVRTAIGVLAGAGGLGAMIKSQLNAADEMQKFSQRVGISTEALSELRHAANLSGVPISALEMSLQRMTRRLGEVALTGKGTAASALEQLGLDAQKLAALAPDEQLGAIADALAGVENQSIKVALAQKIFDSEGVKMIQMLEQGSAGLDKMRESARAAGVTLTTEGANAAARANDAFTQLSASIGAVGQAFAIGFAPEIAAGLEWVVNILPKIIAGFKTVGRVIGAVAAAAAAVFRGEFGGASAVGNLQVGDIYKEELGKLQVDAKMKDTELTRMEGAIKAGVTEGLSSGNTRLVEVQG
jgi:hypothetical protein